MLLSAVVATAMLYGLLVHTRLFERTFEIRRISLICLVGLIFVVFSYAGANGLAVLITAASIGMIPTLFGLSRIYCLAGLIVFSILMLQGNAFVVFLV